MNITIILLIIIKWLWGETNFVSASQRASVPTSISLQNMHVVNRCTVNFYYCYLKLTTYIMKPAFVLFFFFQNKVNEFYLWWFKGISGSKFKLKLKFFSIIQSTWKKKILQKTTIINHWWWINYRKRAFLIMHGIQ